MLERGQALSCGCVVGAYWCWPHDIYARREADQAIWAHGPNGTFVWGIRRANAHMPPSDCEPIRPERDDYRDYHFDRCCSCHISPPCSVCVDAFEEEDSNG